MAGIYLKDALENKENTGNGINAGGEMPIKFDDTVWVDLIGYVVGRDLDRTRSHVTYNFDDATIEFDDSADTTNSRDALTLNYQLNHMVDRGIEDGFTGTVYGRPHIHWLQKEDADVAWLWQYRIIGNGQAASDWSTKEEITHKAFDYVSNTNGMGQITSLGNVDITDLPISSIIQVKLWRDGGSANDTYTGDPGILSSDSHVPVKYPGSAEEFHQYPVA